MLRFCFILNDIIYIFEYFDFDNLPKILFLGTIEQMPKKPLKPKLEYSTKRDVLITEAIIRPTGLLDPIILLRPVDDQVENILEEVRIRTLKKQRVLITALTKKFAEELDIYFKQINIKSAYIHSDVDTLDRLDILADLRRGKYDVLIGINLLREGLDLPEVSLVAIFDADKEGFLRSKSSLVQIVGRAARHSEGTVIMYAQTITRSMRMAIDETEARRQIQIAYNLKHGITPISTTREIATIADEVRENVENDEGWGKAGAMLTHNGFEEVDPFAGVKVENRFKDGKGSKQLNRYGVQSMSVHGDVPMNKQSSKGKQVYDSFEVEKQKQIDNYKSQKLSRHELQSRLDVAIGAMDFEEAAAIRDILQEM
jgi:excinuclease UvrABC helicase subunit UvrB